MTTTDEVGRFEVEELPAGEYIVTPVQPGFIFEPVEQRIQLGERAEPLIFRRVQPDEGMTDIQLEQTDSIPLSGMPEDDVILPNGQRLSDYVKMRGISIDSSPDPDVR